MKKIMLIAIAMLFMGCVGKLEVATCEKYEDGKCINAKVETLKECKDPLIQGDKTYCH